MGNYHQKRVRVNCRYFMVTENGKFQSMSATSDSSVFCCYFELDKQKKSKIQLLKVLLQQIFFFGVMFIVIKFLLATNFYH